MIRNYKLTLRSEEYNVPVLRTFIMGVLHDVNCSQNKIREIKSVASELFLNTIHHAYLMRADNLCLDVNIEIELMKNKLKLTVEDFGVGIEDIEKAKEPMFTTKGNESRAGIGFTIVEGFTESYKIISNHNFGTKVIAVINLAE